MDTVLLFLLLVAIGGVVVLLFLYLSLKSQLATRLANERDYWRNAARTEAQGELDKWRATEIDKVTQQQLEIARREVAVELEQWKQASEQSIRTDAIQRSQSVTIGKITEHLVPYLPGFAYNPKDARFIGSPIDLIIFDGLNDGEVRKVIFMEVKTGASNLNTKERLVRNAILAGKVDWIEYHPSADANVQAVKS